MDSMEEKLHFEDVLERDNRLVYTNRGISMLPLLRQGKDILVIDKIGPEGCRCYDAVLFKRDNGQYVLHRVLKIRNGRYWILGDNCVVGEWVREDQLLGILTGVLRGGQRKIDFHSLGYRLYVRLWCAPWRLRIFLQKAFHFPRRCASFFVRRVLKIQRKSK